MLKKILLTALAAVALWSPAVSSVAEENVQLAKPMDYKSLSDSHLGVNENGKGLEAGHQLANIILNDTHGQPYNLSEAWSERPALLVFYRGGWCPYCNAQVREMAVNYPTLRDAGVQPVLISVDKVDNAAKLSAQYEIPFPVLSDPDLTAHRAFNVVLELDADTLKKYREYGIELSQWSGQAHNSIAVASVFLIDRQGRVVVSHATEDYAQRPSIDQLLKLIEENLPDR